MSGKKLEFLNAPDEHLRTWDIIWKLMIFSGAATLLLLLVLGLVFV